MEFGKLEVLDLRTAWANEATNFTPWLADNIQVVGDILGLELELREREASVGAFSCDLHATDMASGRAVIIENQLEATDHSHLGQLLTYAAGLDASIVVWIAREIRDEHRAALDWLNRKTSSETTFFAVVPRVFRIDNSRPTYELQLIVSPNEWEKDGAHSTNTGPSPRGLQYKTFYQSLIDLARKEGFRGLKNALPQNWIRLTSERADIGYYLSFTKYKTFAVQIYLEASDPDLNKQRFDAAYAHQSELGLCVDRQLIWERLNDSKGARISASIDLSINSSTEQLEAERLWAVNTLAQFRDQLMPKLLPYFDSV